MMGLTTKKLAIDLGDANTRVYIRKKGLVVQEPTVLAYDETSDTVVATGAEALSLIRRSDATISIIQPLNSGVIADFEATKQLLREFIHKAAGRVLVRRLEVMITISATASSTEKRALIDALHAIGVTHVHVVQSAIAAALGAGLPIRDPKGSMVVDIGSGTCEIGVFSLGGTVSMQAVRIGGADIFNEVRRYLRRNLNIALGESEVRQLVHEFIDLSAKHEKMTTVYGQNTIQGTPKSGRIKHSLVISHIERPLNVISLAIRKTLEKTPPDLISDIANHGLMLTGGVAQLQGLDTYLSKQLNVAVIKAKDPMLCSIKGAYLALTHAEDYRKAL